MLKWLSIGKSSQKRNDSLNNQKYNHSKIVFCSVIVMWISPAQKWKVTNELCKLIVVANGVLTMLCVKFRNRKQTNLGIPKASFPRQKKWDQAIQSGAKFRWEECQNHSEDWCSHPGPAKRCSASVFVDGTQPDEIPHQTWLGKYEHNQAVRRWSELKESQFSPLGLHWLPLGYYCNRLCYAMELWSHIRNTVIKFVATEWVICRLCKHLHVAARLGN